MSNRFSDKFTARIKNWFVSTFLRLGLPIDDLALLTVVGRKSGRPRTTPVAVGRRGEQRWLTSPYGEVEWVRNLRVAGVGTLTRGRKVEHFRASPLGPREAAPLLKESVVVAPRFVQKHFAVAPDAPIEAFERIVPDHPVFLLGPIEADARTRRAATRR